jgi:prepilin-type N-terminal cleavage/methylation domain-containing protein
MAGGCASGDRGFSITELLVASALVLLVVAALGRLAVPATEAAHAQPEASDLQQRARMAAAALFRDLYAAGAGLDALGPGPLSNTFAPILPRRIGALSPDVPETARPDAVSIVWVGPTRVQSTIVAPFSMSSLAIRQEPGCPPALPACGARPGMGLAVFDPSGTFNLFTVESVDSSGAVVRPRGDAPLHLYGDGAWAAEVEARTYYLDTAARQLRQYDTDQTDVPVLDDVVGLSVEYFGTSAPPVRPRPLPGDSNCLYDAGGVPLPGLALLPVESHGLARLPLEILRDGPWCGEGDTRYDADLLRVRRLRVSLRLQAGSPSLRASGDRFAIAGTARSATRSVPDVVVAFDVHPRNLNLTP